MRGGHEQQAQIASETVVNDVKKLVIWLDLGLLYSCVSRWIAVFLCFSLIALVFPIFPVLVAAFSL